MLVTTGRFSGNEEFRARATGIILLDGEWVVSAVINFGLGISRDSLALRFSEAAFREQIDSVN